MSDFKKKWEKIHYPISHREDWERGAAICKFATRWKRIKPCPIWKKNANTNIWDVRSRKRLDKY